MYIQNGGRILGYMTETGDGTTACAALCNIIATHIMICNIMKLSGAYATDYSLNTNFAALCKLTVEHAISALGEASLRYII